MYICIISTLVIHVHVQCSLYIMDTLKVALLYRGVLYVEVILYSKECNWYTRCCPFILLSFSSHSNAKHCMICDKCIYGLIIIASGSILVLEQGTTSTTHYHVHVSI